MKSYTITRSGGTRKKLYRSRYGIFMGVCSGLAERFDFSPWGVRLLFIVLQVTIVPVMFLVYILMAFIMKREPDIGYTRWRY